jgi:TolB-like protein/pimeloyl-ACP methyl ester carboxylesterase/Tfp pilus assembly protein PilF/predicted Ser/Thr protein kinase
MTPKRWQQIKALLQSALEREPDQRSTFLAAACGDDESLRNQIESLIISHDQAGPFIEDPAFKMMGGALTANQSALSIGQTFGHYQIRELLGTGGMGEVYLAEDQRLGRKVALKLLPPFLINEAERMRRFQQEARTASTLNHPNLLTIYEIGQIDSHHFIAMEFIEGETLRQRLIKQPMKIVDALDVATQVASALATAHHAGIAHRDIKPENIMLRTDGIVKVLDFGLAKLVERKSTESEAATILLTKEGVVMGTPHYMSPEQTRGLTVDARTDVWSLGVLLYEMIGGRVPFAGETPSDVIVSILEREPPPLARFTAETPDVLQSIVTEALQKNASERYQTISDFLTDLKNLKDDLDLEEKLQTSGASCARRLASGVAVQRPQTRYAKSGEVNIAYQVIGRGPMDLVYVMGWVTNLDYFWEEPSYAQFLHRLASGSRLILFDKRGTGLSDRVHESELPTLEQRMDDVRVVMDAVGSERATLLGVSEGGPMSALFAATYPDRTSALIMYGSYAKRIWSPDYPWAPTPEERQEFFDLIAQGWGGVVDAAIMAPSRARDDHFKEWWATYLRRSASPGAALAFARMNTQIDITNILPSIRVPTLIIHRTGDRDANVGGARYMAEQIPGAKYVELPGNDHLPFVGNQGAILDEIEIFLGDIQSLPELDRVVATVLCFDLAGTTEPTRFGTRRASFLERATKEIARFRGRVLETRTNFLASFDGPARAIRAACAIRDSAQRLGLMIKAGLHTGECDLIDDKITGLALEASARVAEKAQAGEVLVSSTVKDLVAGSGIQFKDHGVRLLRGVEGKWRLFAVVQSGELETETRPARSLAAQPMPRGKAIDSLAVLPLANLSADPSMEYLSDGITESIINSFSRLAQLRVMAHSSVFRYKGQAPNPQQVGRDLGVRAVLTGKVLQLGDRLIVRTELVDTTDGSHLWGEQYERNPADILALQEEIAREISEKLRLKLSDEEQKRLARQHTVSTAAYHLYLKGRHFWFRRTEEALRKSIEYFKQAIEQDPAYAAAYDGLSDSYALLALRGLIPPGEAFSKAKTAARKALEIDNTLGEALASLAHVRLHEWDWSGLDEEFKRALELNPGHAIAYHWYSEYLMTSGRVDESIAVIRRGEEIDPLSPVIASTLGFAFYFARQYDRAIEQFRKALELDPNLFLPYYRLGLIYSLKGSHQEAVANAKKAVALSGRSTETLNGLAQTYAAAGMVTETGELLEELNRRSQDRYVSPYYLAKIYAAGGDKEQALAWLEKGYAERNPDFIELKVEPVLDSVRKDRRFIDLLHRVGLEADEGVPSAPATRTSVKSHLSTPLSRKRDPPKAISSLAMNAVRKSPGRKRTARSSIKSLAILPFTNSSADPNMEYLSDGLTESIINALSQLPKLKVMARSSVFRYKGREVDPQEAGNELQVHAVLTGRVQQFGEKLIVAAELVDASDGSQLWGEQYRRMMADIFALQEEISQQISGTLQLKLSGAERKRLGKRYTENTKAYELYLKGRYFWNQRTAASLFKGIDYFEQAIKIDPLYALAHAGLADCYVKLGDTGVTAISPAEAFARGRAAATRALEIDDSLAEIHASLGHLHMHLLQWGEAENDFKRAIRLNPNYATAHHWYAYYKVFHRRFDEALAEIETARRLDPLSAAIDQSVGEFLYFAHRYDEAIERLQKTLELDPNHFDTRIYLARAYNQKRMFREAEEQFTKVEQIGEIIENVAALGHTYALAGRKDAAKEVLGRLDQLVKERYVSPYEFASIHVALGQTDEALSLLEKGYDQRVEWMIFANVDPRLDPLRPLPAFQELLQRLGFGFENAGAR